MTLSIEDLEILRLLDELVRFTGESETEVIRKALEDYQQRLLGWNTA
jgi:hypothetical protein